ncbi:MAG: OmpA family protein [Sandaracinaceae bacterium]|nr:OmpA family protein [Myxococcales bacterium]MCB9661847.1 OmpA family protein [Sandaracinaceae bacterium]
MNVRIVPRSRVSAALSCFLLSLAAAAPLSAQTFTGHFPRTELPNTWTRPNGACNGLDPNPSTVRTFNTLRVTLPAAGNWTVTATRTGGGPIAMDFYQPTFQQDFPCSNRWNLTGVQGTNSVSRVFTNCATCTGSTYFFEMVVSGANATDAADFTVTVTGPAAITPVCFNTGSVAPSIQSVAASGGAFSATYSPGSDLGCQGGWTSSGAPAWISGIPASGSGPTTLNYTVAANTGSARNAFISIGATSFSVRQAAASCSYALTPTSTSRTASAGSGTATMTATSSCSWSANSNAAWLTTSASGSGSGSLSYSFTANTGPARSGTINAGGASFTLNQASGCTGNLASSSASVGAAAGSSSVGLVMSNGACPWTTSEAVSWITGVTANGTGSGNVNFTFAANTGPARSGNITIAGNTFTVNQAAGCSASLPVSSASVGAAGTTSSATITMTAGSCSWTASTSTPWISGVTPSGTGSGSVSYTVAANTGPARTGTITMGGQTFTVNQASGCTAMLASSGASAGAVGGVASVGLTMSNPACPWTASSGTPWIGAVTPSGTGSASVSYTVAPNPGLARTGTITVAGQTFTVTQANGCAPSLPASSASVSAGAGTTSAGISMSDPACPWTASTSTPWISAVTASGTGSGVVNYTVAANVGPLRSGTITIGGLPFTVTQANGCAAVLTPSSASPGAGGGGGSLGIALSDQACVWTAVASAPWVTGVTAGGTGDGTVSYSVAPNTGPARTATVAIGGQTFTVNQASGCSVAVAPMTAGVGAAAGSTTFAITTDPGCGWTASSLDAWVTGVTPSGTGPGTVTVDYVANPGLVRSGLVSVASTGTASTAEFMFTQANGCSAAIAPSMTSVGAGGATSSVALTMSDAACPFTVGSDQAFVTPLVTSGMGSTNVGFTVDANVGPARSATLTVAGQPFAVTQTSGCALVLTPTGASVGAAAGTTSFDVATAPGCVFTTSESLPWVTSVTPAGTGAGAVSVTYDANVGLPRNGNIRVSSVDTGVTADFALDQVDGCTASLDTSSISVDASANTESVVLTMSDPACPYTVSANDAWLTPDTMSGSGSATIGYDVAANVGPERMGTLSVAGETLTVTQASGCSIDIAPAASTVSESAGTASFDVTTAPGCTYAVTHAVPWLVSVPLTGTGPGAFGFGYGDNTGVERSGILTVTTDTGDAEDFTLTQTDGCVVTLPVSAADVTAAGGTSDFIVEMGSGCSYTAASSDAWLSATVTGTGVTYTATAWDGAARSADITVSSDTSASSASFTVSQASGCVVMLTPGSATAAGAGQELSFSVATGPGCTFGASSPDDFITDIVIAGDTVTLRIGENGRTARMGSVVVTADMTDSEGTFVIQQGEGDGRPGDGGVAVGVVPVGDGCAATPGTRSAGAAFLALLVVLGLGFRRKVRARAVVSGAVLLSLASPSTGARAQAFEEGYDLMTYRPASSARIDYGSVESGESRLAGYFELGATLGYDALPLVVDTSNGETARAVAGQGWLRLGGAFAIGQRLRLGVQMPFVLARHGDAAVLPDYPDVDRAAVGDFVFTPKVTLLTRPLEAGASSDAYFGRGFALALLLPVTLPTGQAGRLAGEGVTVEPRVALDYATQTGFGGALNVGFRLRGDRHVIGNELDEAITLGLAGRVPVVNHLFAVVEVVADVAVRTPDTRNASRGEALASLRYMNESLVVSGGLGAGFLGGLATPRFRLFASVTYAPTHGRRRAEDPREGADVPTEPEVQPEAQVQPEPEPEPVLEPAPDPEPPVAEVLASETPPAPEPHETDTPELDHCEADPSARGCGPRALCGTEETRALRDTAGLTTVSGFETDSATLPAGSEASIARIAERLQSNPDIDQVILVGHADPRGTRAHNAGLSRRRAQQVRDALVRAGVAPERLRLRAVGSLCAEPPYDAEENRRVELLIVQ